MTMNSPSSNSSLLPTGGFSSERCWSTQARRLNGGETRMARLYRQALHLHGRGRRRVEAQRGEASAPDASRVQADHIGILKISQRRPVAEDDPRAAPTRAGGLEPGNERGSLPLARRALRVQVELPVLVHVAQPGEAIDDVAQPLRARKSVVPAVRLVAVHVLEELLGLAAQGLLELARAGARGGHVPLGR